MTDVLERDSSRSKDLSVVAMRKTGTCEILARQAMAWCRYWLLTFPVTMTLNNIGFLAVSLAIVLPRSIIYRLVYPIFRLVFGTLYPAYASYKAVRTKNVKEYVKWMMYWIVFALFTCAETFTDVFFSFWFPFYYEIKIILVLWLLSPATKGSSILYRRFVHPALIRREAEIDEALARATEQGYTAVLHLGTKGVNYATTVLMQTAIKGGGGLVQQLRKSYSLSDLTGEKEDENRNTPDTHDETDVQAEPRRREHVGRRGYSPRRTQSSSNRVEMYFSEVDVDVRQPRPREPVASLTNIRSSDDISSGYSSGEALQSHRAASQGDSLVRTSSVGARTRSKPRSATKKTPEDRDEDFDRIDLSLPENTSLPSSLNALTPEQAVELLLLLSRNKSEDGQTVARADGTADANRSAVKIDEHESPPPPPPPPPSSSSLSSTESSGPAFVDADFPRADVRTVQTIEIENISTENLSIVRPGPDTSARRESDPRRDEADRPIEYIDDGEVKGEGRAVSASSAKTDVSSDGEHVTDEICQQRFDELKQLLSDAHRAVTGIVSSRESLNVTDQGKKRDESVPGTQADDEPVSGRARHDVAAAQRPVTPSYTLDEDNRAGKYHKKPAPKAPLASQEDDVNENEPENALKATLVIKTGTLRTFSNADVTKDVFLAHAPANSSAKKKKKSGKLRAKESFSKLLTIPRNIFHSAFHKEQNESSSKEEDSSSSTLSETSGSASRSGSVSSSQLFVDTSAKMSSSSKQEADVEEIPLRPERDDEAGDPGKSVDRETAAPGIVTRNKAETGLDKIGSDKAEDERATEKLGEKSAGNKTNSERSLHDGRKEIVTDI
ncbi:Receptor expression-enhancing protein 1 [Harpegnathos saltator]|uniref:Receptor expression-enhancing protein 1 n=1 Tax=Harpegnathos saltator TaxID=610380 RepID=E2B7I4_HARSA|nr:Receptor expression-enhancing protein 1 [Harpegnathos saltator]